MTQTGHLVYCIASALLLPLVWFSRRPFHEPNPISIRDLSIDDLSRSLDDRLFTSQTLVQTYLARIAEVNPTIHSVAETNPAALETALILDKERAQRGPRRIIHQNRKIHGIPILVKDSISVHGMNNTAGSYCLVDSKTKVEASIIQRLRGAGAIILGKDNLSQWGNARSSSGSTSNGWSAWGGQIYGVYYPHQDPCGSSSGSAVSMALGLAAAAIGAETVGSITCPAMRSNLVSIKPTVGLVPRDNVIVPKLRGTVGPMARNVRDAATLLSFIAGPNSYDTATESIPFDTIPTYESACDIDGLQNSRLDIPRNAIENPFGADMNKTAVMAVALAPQNYVGSAEYKADIAGYLAGLEINPRQLHSLEDLIEYTKSHPSEEYPSRDIESLEKVRVADDRWSYKILTGWERMQYLGGEGGIDGALNAAKADALIFPSIVSSDVPGLAGYPVITVPLGFMPPDTPVKRNIRGNLVEEGPGIPFGLSFIGRRFSEETLIRLAYVFEQATQFAKQRNPIILPTTEISNIKEGKIGFQESMLRRLMFWSSP